MNKLIINYSTLLVLFIISNLCYCQSPFYSESLIKYDLSTHKTNKPIPFDRSFTLVIEKLSSKYLIAVHAYEAKFSNGERLLVENNFRNCEGKTVTAAVKDIELKFNPYSDTLQIFFPPLKPNVDFDINVIYGLSKKCKALLMKVNAQLSQGTPSAEKTFNQFFSCTFDEITNTTYTDINFCQYKKFYDSTLSTYYTNISNATNYSTKGTLSENQLHAIDKTISKQVSDFKNGIYLLEVFKRGLFVDIQIGNKDISKVFLSDAEALTDLHSGDIRLQNLESNIKFFDSILKGIDRVISKGITSVLIAETNIDLDTTRTDVQTIIDNLRKNCSYLEDQLKVIDAAIDNDSRLKQGIYLAGNTVSSDLKAAGGNILFIDAGFTNIIAPGLINCATYIPKLYWGICIYFRPIDKNTRTSRFPKEFEPKEYYGCHRDTIVDKDGTIRLGPIIYGPDYGIVTKYSIWQNLSLNLGLTLGSMTNKDFDNFYNNSSLLIGPAYRFTRAFKVSSGVALLKRTSKNPLISEKKVIAGCYISLSVDIDFIQGIKDVTSILYK